MRFYIDSSAIVTTIFDKSQEQFSLLHTKANMFTSRLSQVEVLRSIMKLDASFIPDAIKFLSGISYVEMVPGILDTASLYPTEITLKSSDAIHMATAEQILDSDDLLITFDKQMAANAERLGIKVATSF